MKSVSPIRVCSVPNCGGRHEAKGFCQKHYVRLKRTGTTDPPLFKDSCEVPECPGTHHAKGLCRTHWRMVRNLVNQDQIRKQKQEYRAENSEAIQKTRKIYRTLNRETIRQKDAEYYKKNPEIARRNRERRRARLAGVPFENFTTQQVLDTYGDNCHLCHQPIDLKAPRKPGVAGWEYGLHLDHKTALARGGAHTLENVRPSHGVCNLRKGKG